MVCFSALNKSNGCLCNYARKLSMFTHCSILIAPVALRVGIKSCIRVFVVVFENHICCLVYLVLNGFIICLDFSPVYLHLLIVRLHQNSEIDRQLYCNII